MAVQVTIEKNQGYLNIFTLAGKTVGDELTIQVNAGALYLNDTASRPDAASKAYSFGAGDWCTLRADSAGGWVSAQNHPVTFTVG